MKTRLVAAFVVSLVLRAMPASANLSASDFYCSDIPQDAAPLIYDNSARNCPGGTDTIKHLCYVQGQCIVLTPEFRKQVRDSMGKEFADMTPVERSDAVRDNPGYGGEPQPALLNCEAVLDGGTLACPLPDSCKREVVVSPHRAHFGKVELNALKFNFKHGKTGASRFTDPAATPGTPPADAADAPAPK